MTLSTAFTEPSSAADIVAALAAEADRALAAPARSHGLSDLGGRGAGLRRNHHG